MKILVPVDFHKTSFSAYQYATRLASLVDGEICLLHVINGTFSMNEVVAFDPLSSMEDAAEKRLEYFASTYANELGVDLPKVFVKKEVRIGIPGFAIGDYANQNDIDIVIMGTRDRHGIFDRLLGSTSTTALRVTKCPVMLIHEATKFKTPEKIAFAFDERSDLEEAIEDYKKFNQELNAKTDFVHVNIGEKDDLSEQKEEILDELFEDENPSFSFEIKAIEAKDLKTGLKDYCLFEKIDILAMMHRKEGIFFNLFRPNHSIRMAQEYHLPVIVFHED